MSKKGEKIERVKDEFKREMRQPGSNRQVGSKKNEGGGRGGKIVEAGRKV